MYLFFDTETNGLPKDYNASVANVDNWPRIIQLAWQRYDENRQLVEQYCELIKPDGWNMPTEKFWAEKGYTHENSVAKGVPIRDAIEKFVATRHDEPFSIAHNISFDSKIIRAEMFRLNINDEFSAKKICTMMSSTSYCKLLTEKSNRFKWPKLEELYFKLFEDKFEGAHDALVDVKATATCFFELVDRKVISLT